MKLKPQLILAAWALLTPAAALLGQVQITLPVPIHLETFDSVEEGKLPPGWSVVNFTDEVTPGEDLDDPKSDSYKNWVVISKERVLSNAWEGPRRLSIAPSQFVNGVLVTNIMEGRFIYAESDVRGGSQVQYLFSPDFDLTGKSSIFLSFHSMYEQNQDSIGSVEYSVDQGNTWLPIIYMIDGPDIKRAADGSVDGYETLNAINADTAALIDPVTGEDVGRRYGAFIGVSSNRWSTLGSFISARVNDDSVESKRIELFKLDKADNQSKVRIRFAQAGTGSWYFGVDNFGLYSIVQTKAGRPTVKVPAEVSFFDATTFTGSAFVPATPGQTHGLSVWQISDSPAFGVDKGLANVSETYSSSKNLTSLSVLLGRVVPGQTYYVSVQYKDASGAGSDFSEPVAFKVTGTFPSPLFSETFESTAPGEVPTGWTATHQTDGETGAFDPADFRSDNYLNWTVVPFDVLTTFGGDRVNNTTVVNGKSLYAVSDGRTGNQIQIITTPDLNLAGKNNIWLSYKSNYKQNQDSFGGVEYSVDGGVTWLPVIYMIDTPDISIGADGSIDAAKTLTTTAGDIAKVIDSATSERVAAGSYGDFILAKPLASLGAFISGRLNDNDNESKRIERFRLTAADNQAKVRLRFVQAGTDSWFWGIDDVGLYSIAPSTPAKTEPDAPTISLPASLSFLDKNLTFTGSAFSGILPADANAQTILQISAAADINPTNGFSAVLVVVTNSAGATAISASAERLFPGQTYHVAMQYKDKNGVTSRFSTPVSFTVAALGAPIYFEDFESTSDFGVPAGWTLSNQTDTVTAGLDPANPKSDSYKDWIVVPFSTLTALGGGRADFPSVVSGKSLYSESDNRGGNQIQVALSPVYDLRGRSDVSIAFKSNYVQNQDSIGVLEYTVDGRATWLPLSYLVNDKPSNTDVVRVAGVIDPVATLNTTAGDIAKSIDPATGSRVAAGKYADFILASPISALGPFISGRIDDDKTESRRYERFSLPAAANQAAVQFRFVQAGTGSWWWAIDDLGIYGSGAALPKIAFARQGGNIVLTWGAGAVLQSAPAVTGPWTNVDGASSGFSAPVSDQQRYFRLNVGF